MTETRHLELLARFGGTSDGSTSDIRKLSADELTTIADTLSDRNHAQLMTIGTQAYVRASHHARVLDVLTELVRRFTLQRTVIADLAAELDLNDRLAS